MHFLRWHWRSGVALYRVSAVGARASGGIIYILYIRLGCPIPRKVSNYHYFLQRPLLLRLIIIIIIYCYW